MSADPGDVVGECRSPDAPRRVRRASRAIFGSRASAEPAGVPVSRSTSPSASVNELESLRDQMTDVDHQIVGGRRSWSDAVPLSDSEARARGGLRAVAELRQPGRPRVRRMRTARLEALRRGTTAAAGRTGCRGHSRVRRKRRIARPTQSSGACSRQETADDRGLAESTTREFEPPRRQCERSSGGSTHRGSRRPMTVAANCRRS